MDSWTSKDKLLQDLARAQGGTPLTISDPLCFHETPTKEYEKEKEEHNLSDANAAADFSQGPDINMIMQMLDMVNDYDVSETESNTCANSNLNPFSPEFIPNSSTASTLVPKSTTKKINRNAAIESILKAQKSNPSFLVNKYLPSALRNKLKTEDPKMNVGTEKKQNCFPSVFNSNIGSSMFKKKVSNKSNETPAQSKNSQEMLKTNKFVPSTLANSYYEKFVENNETKKDNNNDIWTVVKQKLKEFNERKESEAVKNISIDTETNISEDASQTPSVFSEETQ